MATRKPTKERVYRAGGSDPRSGPERFMSAISRAISPDKSQNRRWDDSPEKMASDRRKTAKRLEEEAAKRGKGKKR